jgi:hypothetical protein
VSRATVTYKGVELDVIYEYERGFAGDRIDPPYPATASIESVTHKGDDLMDLLTGKQLEDIADRVCDAHEDGVAAAQQDHRDNLRKECALENRQ